MVPWLHRKTPPSEVQWTILVRKVKFTSIEGRLMNFSSDTAYGLPLCGNWLQGTMQLALDQPEVLAKTCLAITIMKFDQNFGWVNIASASHNSWAVSCVHHFMLELNKLWKINQVRPSLALAHSSVSAQILKFSPTAKLSRVFASHNASNCDKW